MELIHGVKIKELKPIPDERGRLMEMLRADDDLFIKFGQAYITSAKPGFAKAWHYHTKQTDNFVCIKGKVKVVLYDSREDSPTKGMVNEFFLSLEEPKLIQIPPLVYHGFECACDEESFIINMSTEVYVRDNPDEKRLPFDSEEVPYTWDAKEGR